MSVKDLREILKKLPKEYDDYEILTILKNKDKTGKQDDFVIGYEENTTRDDLDINHSAKQIYIDSLPYVELFD